VILRVFAYLAGATSRCKQRHGCRPRPLLCNVANSPDAGQPEIERNGLQCGDKFTSVALPEERMFRRSRIFLIVLASIDLAVVAFAQTPRTSTPDLTVVWATSRGAGGARGGGGGRGNQPELPLRPEAKAKVQEYQRLIAGTGDTPGGYCLGTGMPGSMLGSGGYPMEIIQRPDQITIVYEAHNEIRRVYLGNRVIPEKDRLPERNGYSVGRWEGNTLVVETTKLNEQVDQRYAHSDKARIVERYTLSEENGQKVLTAEMTMTDPDFYTAPVSETKKWSHVPNGFLMTYECNEPAWLDRLEALRAKNSKPTK
jgi:hypothetical protein